jgi:hypothetical protein
MLKILTWVLVVALYDLLMNYNTKKVVYSFYVDTTYFELYGVCRLKIHGMVKLLQTKIFSGQQPYTLITNYISGTTSGFGGHAVA